jgi:hypothetical protein
VIHRPSFDAHIFSTCFNCCVVVPVAGYTAGKVLVKGDVPDRPVRGDEVVLQCNYEILVDGAPLYSVRWYKDGKEFYSFLPDSNPPKKTFNVVGVRVDVSIYRSS